MRLIEWLAEQQKALGLTSERAMARFLGVSDRDMVLSRRGKRTRPAVVWAAFEKFPHHCSIIRDLYLGERRNKSDAA